jgi:hypothetical protein
MPKNQASKFQRLADNSPTQLITSSPDPKVLKIFRVLNRTTLKIGLPKSKSCDLKVDIPTEKPYRL